MAQVQRTDIQGSQNEFCSVYNVEVETENYTYFFAFESSFYSCQRRDDRKTVESGTESGLEEMDEESVEQFCRRKVKEYEEMAEA
ncbi:MAG: hypothetical protein ACI8Z7_000750 [Candidatus Nanohaloarchaea archaeon]|jgi:hypothetical protein